MKLYYAPGACSLADHIALIEMDLPFDTEKVDLKAKRTETGADFTAINPKGYVPALALDDGAVLTENIAVLSYLADRSGRLMPAGGMARWRMLETLAYVSTELHKNFKPFFNPAASDAEKNEAKQILGKRFQLVADQIGDRAFLVGDGMSVADCYLFVMLMWAREKVRLELPEQLSAYHERIGQRPAVRQALAAEGIG